ncbi:glycosyltransferase [Natronolimnohabitans innermongolicus]|uniref:Glycosyltransferase 2-like domain-containing protein n=1 Tax=Natronolimnohabitans innermongolicus JCM 12255 TaxID=1227499 RepID=L9WNZ2_9EURY|nr:glycosyltransferase family 2 protein [Natronolimnohabitans innermongolicus]ELY51184.1 hypothetical protein C493_17771 [Natronolimnohabitans innermongolicus JCM 12255]
MVLEVVLVAFVATQLCYFVANCGLLALFLRRPMNRVDERTLGTVLERAEKRRDGETRTEIERGPGPDCRLPADLRRRVHVFVPLVGEQWDALESTLASLAAQSYPASSLTVHVVYEPRDRTALELEGAIEPRRPPGLEIETVAVDGETNAVGAMAGDDSSRDERDGQDRGSWLAPTGVPPATAAMLAAAYEDDGRGVAGDDLVTVIDADTWLPVDALELAVAGLEEYDIVQAKRSVRNVDFGILPLLESTAAAVRSDLLPTSSSGPYAIQETGYVTEARVLEDVARWHRERDEGGALPLGLAASRRGYDLGVLDRFVLEGCPPGLEAWFERKRSSSRELYRRVAAHGWTAIDDVRCWSGRLLLQSIALVSVVGVPAAALVAWPTLTGSGAESWSVPLSLQLLVGFNVVLWGYYSVRAYRAAWRAYPFRNRLHRLAYSLLSNPFTQALYAMASAAPIALAAVDLATGGDSSPTEPTEPTASPESTDGSGGRG